MSTSPSSLSRRSSSPNADPVLPQTPTFSIHAAPSDSPSSSGDEPEDYDSVLIDPDALIDGAMGGMTELQRRASHNDADTLAVSESDHDDSNLGHASHTAHLLESSRPFIARGHRRSSFPASGHPFATTASSHPSLDKVRRRRSAVKVTLEKLSKKGKFTLAADDPEIRDILRRGLEREDAAAAAALTKNSSQRTRLRDLVFTRQFTTFDRQNPLSADSPIFGFFTLFWLAMLLIFIKVAAGNYRQFGSILGSNEMMRIMFSRDVVVLGLTDLVMLSSTTFGFFLQRLIAQNVISWSRFGIVLQNIWQAVFLFTIIWWTYYRDWPWTHTAFMVLHTLVYLMKQHSYAFYNGHLSCVARRRQMLRIRLDHLQDIDIVRSTTPSKSKSKSSSSCSASSVAMNAIAAAAAAADVESDNKTSTRPSMGVRTATNLKHENSDIASVSAAIESGQPLDTHQMEAFERVIQSEIDCLDTELKGKCLSGSNAYPKNLNWKDFIEYTCFPTLVYELEYPRQETINWWYVAEKTAATFGVIGVMMVISQAYIYPAFAQAVAMKDAGMTLQERWNELPWLVGDMLFPLLLEQLLTWYVIWECVLNVLAEITLFASRNFYGLWWNSSGFDYYARNWNRPVHHFLLRHVYHSSISTFRFKKSTATFVTFLLSALVHELVMACLFKKVRGYLFTMQLMQIPMVRVMNTRYMRGKEVLGNVVFWLGMFIGPSVLTSFYLLI